MSKEVEVIITNGLDARNVAEFVQKASDFKSSIFVEYQNKKVNAKSIMGMMSLGAAVGEKVTLTVDGEDEAKALKDLEAFLVAEE